MQRFSDGLEPKEMGPDGSVDRDRAVSDDIRKSLRATGPWTRLLSALGFIAAILIPTLHFQAAAAKHHYAQRASEHDTGAPLIAQNGKGNQRR